jgi:hypothetical protein
VASPPTGTVTFLFTDIEGSTKLWENNAPAMQAALARHDELLRWAIEEHGGYVFKTVGDAFCCTFSTPRDALEAALVAQRALIRDGKGVQIDEDCSITAGTWFDPYTGKTLTNSSEVDIDHVVPLANAWRSGASSAAWSTADREAYANDPEVLLSVDDAANQTKGDKGPEAWKPPNRDFWCEYARRWIWIKSDWDLSIIPNEKTALNEMLATCKAD